jgi:hypothetical protein
LEMSRRKYGVPLDELRLTVDEKDYSFSVESCS